MIPTTLTEGTLLGGRVIYRQKQDGYRTGMEPVLLAAFVPALPGQRVIEAGTGAGAGLLCLAARVPGVAGVGIEIDPGLVEVASGNLAFNNHTTLEVRTQDIAQWRADTPFDHAFANPPWHKTDGTIPADAARERAKMAGAGVLACWVQRLAAGLSRRGTLNLILPANLVGAGIAALRQADCVETSLLPLWPRAGHAARLVPLRGIRHGRGPDQILPGLILHEADGRYTQAAERVLREGGGLP